MPFLPNIPQPNDQLSVSQGNLLNNNQILGAIAGNVNANSASINAASGFNFVFLPAQGVNPPAGTAFGADVGIYAFQNATTGKSEFYVHKQLQAGTAEIPMTASAMSNNAFAACDNGWSYLPSGLLVKWGAVVANAAAVAITPTVTSGGPNFQRVFRVFVTPFDSGVAVNFTCGQRTVSAAPSGNFTAYCNNFSGTTEIRYLVMGV